MWFSLLEIGRVYTIGEITTPDIGRFVGAFLGDGYSVSTPRRYHNGRVKCDYQVGLCISHGFDDDAYLGLLNKLFPKPKWVKRNYTYQCSNKEVWDKLEYVAGHGARYLDVVAQKEATNQTAKADIVIDGNVLVADVPVTHLLTLETKLKELRQMYEAIPTLDPSVSWVQDPNSPKGVYKSQTASVSFRTEKKLMHKVLVDATDKHPAQIEKWSEDKPVARIETNKTSGMLSSVDKSALLARIDRLAEAVKRARQRANGAPIVEIKVGKTIFDYLHGGL